MGDRPDIVDVFITLAAFGLAGGMLGALMDEAEKRPRERTDGLRTISAAEYERLKREAARAARGLVSPSDLP